MLFPKPQKRAKKNTAAKHRAACLRYMEKFYDRNGYLFCEACGGNKPPVSTHHIVFASRAPQHENLHDDRNLMLCCKDCHDRCHADDEFNDQFIIKRSLWEIFPDKLNKESYA